MSFRLKVLWSAVIESLWFIPALMTLFAAALAFMTVQIDSRLLLDQRAELYWVFGGGTEGARGVLSAIAGSVITVIGVVFSVTIVALQLASSQFSPRVLRNFMNDRASQLVLGTFIGTFTYTLLVLRTIRSDTPSSPVFVPSLSVTVSIILVLISVGFLIFFIDHTARAIQASFIIDRSAKDTLHYIDHLFPEPIGKPAAKVGPELALPETPPNVVYATEAGYLESVDENALFNIAEKGRLIIRMEPYIGDFVLPGRALASIWPPDALDDSIAKHIRRSLLIGPKRSMDQDVEFGITQLEDIAIKALSPGINDPTTAKLCIDRLAEVLVVLGNRAMPTVVRTDGTDRLIFIAQRTTYERAVSLAFDNIRHFGKGTPSVIIHLLQSLEQVVALVPDERRKPLVQQGILILAAARQAIHDPTGMAEIEEHGKWLPIE